MSSDDSIVTNWEEISVSELDSKKHVRVDFKLSEKVVISSDTSCNKYVQDLNADYSAPPAPVAVMNPTGFESRASEILKISHIVIVCLQVIAFLH